MYSLGLGYVLPRGRVGLLILYAFLERTYDQVWWIVLGHKLVAICTYSKFIMRFGVEFVEGLGWG